MARCKMDHNYIFVAGWQPLRHEPPVNVEEFHAKCNFPAQLGSIVIFITGPRGSRPTLISVDAYD